MADKFTQTNLLKTLITVSESLLNTSNTVESRTVSQGSVFEELLNRADIIINHLEVITGEKFTK